MKNDSFVYKLPIQEDVLRNSIVHLYDDYFQKATKVLESISGSNMSVSSEYRDIINSIIARQIIDISDRTMKTVTTALNSSSFKNPSPVHVEQPKKNQSTENTVQYTITGSTFKKKLLSIMRGENYTSGECAPSERFVAQAIEQMGSEHTMRLLMNVYESSYDSPQILIGLLHMISHFRYDIVRPYGPIMALGLLQHSSFSVREFAIKAFENWDNKDTLIFLKNIHCDNEWLQSYLEDVISGIEDS